MTDYLKKLLLLAVVLLFAGPVGAADFSLSPIGRWEVTTGEARYEVMVCDGNMLCAKLTWLRADQRTSDKLALINTYVVTGAHPTKRNKWSGQVLFDGHAYDGTVTMVSKNFMRLNGCSGILCQSYEFTRI